MSLKPALFLYVLTYKTNEDMQKVTISVAALCDKAGRRANQDNIYLSCRDFLQQTNSDGHAEQSVVGLAMPAEGTLLAVADGMGGMNAGEVASQIVVDTLGKEMESRAGQPITDTEEAAAIARRSIVDADNAIKQYVAAHPEVSGTGSTVVLLWILGDKAVVAWCGDSRCYRYNSRRGLEQLSHDHSYVQQLVDEGKLPPEMAFGHAQSNIITRCLSDDKEPAEPDVKVVDIYRDDLFLLCSDGLCGLLPDAVTEQLLSAADGDVQKALANCWQRGSAEGWDDNCSIVLASVGGVKAIAPERKVDPLPKRPSYSTVEVEIEAPQQTAVPKTTPVHRRRRWLLPLLVAVAIGIGVVIGYCLSKRNSTEKPAPRPVPAVKPTHSPSRREASTPSSTLPAAIKGIALPKAPSKPENAVSEEPNDSPADIMQASGEKK